MKMRIKSKRAMLRALRNDGWKVKIHGGNFEVTGKKATRRGYVERFYYFECQYGKTIEVIKKENRNGFNFILFLGINGFNVSMPECALNTEPETKLHNLIYNHSGHT